MGMPEIKTRLLNPQDYDEILDLWQRASLSIRPRGRDSREELLRQMKANPEFFIGAEIEGRLVGVIIATHDTRRGYLNRIAVDPDFRRRGVAQLLTRKAEEFLRSKGIKVITLLIERKNAESRSLVKKMGYVEHPDIIYYSKRQSPED